jgi:NAD(P)H-dependent FMN reductase
VDKQPLQVAVVTQESRIGAWVAGEARRRGGVEVGVVDLAAFGFPGAPTRAFTARLAAAEAFVLVTPAGELPAALAEAIEFGCAEWRSKPVAFVSYGAGTGAWERLRSVFAELHVVIVGADLTAFDRDAAAATLEQLEWWGRALRDRATVNWRNHE